jgi:hypothetical protein
MTFAIKKLEMNRDMINAMLELTLLRHVAA